MQHRYPNAKTQFSHANTTLQSWALRSAIPCCQRLSRFGIPGMRTITSKNKPFSRLNSATTNKITRHMPRSLNHPQGFIPKKVKCFFKRSKLCPSPAMLGNVLGSVDRVEKMSIPSRIWICGVSRRTVFECSRSKVSLGIWKHLGDRSAMVPVVSRAVLKTNQCAWEKSTASISVGFTPLLCSNCSTNGVVGPNALPRT
jgi:hypothetical protein